MTNQNNVFLIVALMVISGWLSSSTAVDCQVDRSYSPCSANCGAAGWFDISQVFDLDHPIMFSEDGYDFYFSPCKGVPCNGEQAGTIADAVLCQVSPRQGTNYTCGIIGQETWTLEQTKPNYEFTVKFTGGSQKRTTTVKFIEDASADTTQTKFINEEPLSNYNFEVTGKYVGQPAPAEQCVVDSTNPCVAKCADKTFDISNLFNYPAKTLAGSNTYSFSPCGGTSCGSKDSAAVCQSTVSDSYSCGSVSSVKWWLNQTKPFNQFTIEYSDGDTGRKSVFTFVEDVKMFTTALILIRESPPLQYNFEVRGKNIGQPEGPTEQCTVDPDKPWVLKCNGSVAVDISDVFKYPVSVSFAGRFPRVFDYNPVSGATCSCNAVPTAANAVCQYSPTINRNYSCGLIQSAKWTVNRTHPFVFSITYDGGDSIGCDGSDGTGNRSSEIIFYEETSEILPPKFSYQLEDPLLNYRFIVTGSYVGQRIGKGTCKMDPKSPCKVICNETKLIDISDLFPYPMTIVGEGGDNFIFSPCSGYSCGNKNSSVCLLSEDGSKYSLGQLSSATWTLRQSNEFFVFLIAYTGGDKLGSTESHSTFTFIENSNIANTVPVYAGVQNGNSYLFDIVGSCVGQPGCNKHNAMKHLHSRNLLLPSANVYGLPLLLSIFIGAGVVLVVVVVFIVIAILLNKKKQRQDEARLCST